MDSITNALASTTGMDDSKNILGSPDGTVDETKSEDAPTDLVSHIPSLCIRIYNLSADTKLGNLKDLIQEFGPTSKMYLAQDRKTQLCKGFAYVHFKNEADAAKALQCLDEYIYNNVALSVSMAEPTKKKSPADLNSQIPSLRIRISNLSVDMSQDDLRDLLQPFGQIKKRFLALDKTTGLCEGFAYVHFKNQTDAAKAFQYLDGYKYNHLILSVDWVSPPTKRNEGTSKKE